jgi:hypothetical protein
MAKFGLPTYPINSGMVLGTREDSEIEWLLERGYIQDKGTRYLTKVDAEWNECLLIQQGYSRGEGDEVIDSHEHWQALTQKHDIKIDQWHWYEQI